MNGLTNVTDIALIVVGAFFVVRGVMRGISGEIISLLSTAGGFYCAMRFYGPAAGILVERLGLSQLVATILTMLAIFFAIFFGCFLLEWSVKKVIEKTKLTSTDKMLGAVVGFAKLYIIAIMLLIAGIILAPMASDGWVRGSRILTLTAKTWPFVQPVLDKAGLIPDMAAIQAEAKEYVLRQAESGIFNSSADITGIIGSADIERALLASSGDVANITRAIEASSGDIIGVSPDAAP
ncbi:MAG: CvpA family protein [Synergistaceae bacterium]|jgi:membrane protein required for colicin V production|nr:CvpA family protein [Synergistaceae bacterium]